MSKLPILAVITIIAVSLIPYGNVTVVNSAPLAITDNVGPDAGDRSIVAYRAVGDYYVYAYQESTSPFRFYLVVARSDGTIVYRGYPALNFNGFYYDVSVDGNATGILLAYRHRRNGGVTHDDLNLAFIRFDGTKVTEIELARTTAHERAPVVKFADGFWFVGYHDYATPGSFQIRLYDTRLTLVHSTSVAIGTSRTVGGTSYWSGVDFRERAFYSPVTKKFYVVAVDHSAPIDLVLIEYDPINRVATKSKITNDGDSAIECNPDFSKEYRMCYAQILGDHKHLLVVYTYRLDAAGKYPVNATIVDLEGRTVKATVTLQTLGTSRNIYPWVSASTTEWLVSWWDGANSNLAFVWPDGTYRATRIVPPTGYTTPGYITHVYNGEDYTVFYALRRDTNDDLYSIRISPTLKRSLTPFVVSNTTHSENVNYPLVIGGKIANLFWKIGATYACLAYLDYTEVPAPEAIPTEITGASVQLGTGGDGYLEAGDNVTVSGVLRELLENKGLPDKTINVKLVNLIYYDSRGFTMVKTPVVERTTRTKTDGSFNYTLRVPGEIVSGLYYVEVSFQGDETYGPSTWSSGNFIIVKTKPAEINWVKPPADVATGPALLYSNGQVVITDPVGEVSTEYRVFNPITDFTGGESDDVDIKLLQIAVDENYIYIKAEFAGNAGYDGEIYPALVLAFDFTPRSSVDGALAGRAQNLLLIYGMGYTDTHLKGGRGWDLLVTLTPRDYYGRVFVDPASGKHALHLTPAYRFDGTWYYREMSAGFLSLSGNTMVAHIPIDTLLVYSTNFKAAGDNEWIVFGAVFPISSGTRRVVPGIPFANWVDVPGVVTTNSTPPKFIEIGIRESATDDRLDTDTLRSWELDTFFRLNVKFPTLEAKARLLYVIDGDTVSVQLIHVAGKFATRLTVGGNYSVRLADIDAPPLGTPEGDAARDALWSVLRNNTFIHLNIDDKYVFDAHGRIVALVYTRVDEGKLLNVNKWLLDNGYASILNLDNEFNPATWTLTVDLENNRFYGYIRLWLEESRISVYGYPTISRDDGAIAYVGTVFYVVKAFDANNTAYGVYGLTVEMLLNGTPVAQGTTWYSPEYNNIGNATIPYEWRPELRGRTHRIAFRASSPDYVEFRTIDFSVKPSYIAKVVKIEHLVEDNDGLPTIGPPDVIKIWIYVDVWEDVWTPAPVGLKFRVFINSTPQYLGDVVVNQPGLAYFEHVVTGEELIYTTEPTVHKIVIYGYPGDTWLIEVAIAEFPYTLRMVPLPEPTVLPLLLLSLIAVTLFFFKTRKK